MQNVDIKSAFACSMIQAVFSLAFKVCFRLISLSHFIKIVFHSKLIIIEDEEAAGEDTEEDAGEDLEFRLWL